MSDHSGAREWVDPRYRDLMEAARQTRREERSSRRPRRVCPHGFGVTMMVDLGNKAPLNVACEACRRPK